MKTLDLGAKSVLKVKLGEDTYEISAPTVEDVEIYQDAMKEDGVNEMDCFMDLVDALGMPKDVVKKLDVVQVKNLSEGLLGLVEKK